jgi:hypothetical protein
MPRQSPAKDDFDYPDSALYRYRAVCHSRRENFCYREWHYELVYRSCNGKCLSTPAGVSCPYTGFISRVFRCWSLIGQIGTGTSPSTAFEVGISLTFTASSSGRFYLGVNDNNYPDNTGSWAAVVTICPSAANTTAKASGIVSTDAASCPIPRVEITYTFPKIPDFLPKVFPISYLPQMPTIAAVAKVTGVSQILPRRLHLHGM